MKFLRIIFLSVLISAGVAEITEHDPKLSDLDRGVVEEIFTILTAGILKVAGGCSEPKSEDLTLYFYNRETIDSPIMLDYNNPHQLDTSKKIVILIHGYLSGASTSGFQSLKNSYLEKYDCNLIIVEWKKYAWGLYTTAVCMLPKIANLVGDFMCKLSEQKSYNLNNIHFVGHSLGAQMSGLTGQAVQEKCNQTIGRITGLDPAGPLFFGIPHADRLDFSDAQYVDIIHTNGGIFGYLTNLGHTDYYVNCGSVQFCKPFDITLTGILNLPVSVVTCHHSASIEYMAKGVKTNDFKGIPCSGCPLPGCPPVLSLFNPHKPIMGEMSPTSTRGSYFVPVSPI